MPVSNFSIQRLAYYLICLSIVLFALYSGSSFFIPLVYGMFFALMLKPISNLFERVVHSRVAAILGSILFVGLVISGVLYFFASQIMEVVDRADNIFASLEDSWSELTEWCGEMVGFDQRETTRFVEDQLNPVVEAPWNILSVGLSTSGQILANLALVMIYCFFFLLYSTAFKRFLLSQFSADDQRESLGILRNIQAVATDYLSGILTVMLILGVLNSLGLYLIGIKYAMVWGFLGAILAIIPYVGTTIGGLLPFVYAIATTDTAWQPLAVVILYVTVQFVEGNFITPKIVGNSVKINALAAVLSLIFGALIWGLAGIIIAIPLLAMTRIILEQIPPFRSLALLLSDDLYDESDRFLNEFNHPNHRIMAIFSRRPLVGYANEVTVLSTENGEEILEENAGKVNSPMNEKKPNEQIPKA